MSRRRPGPKSDAPRRKAAPAPKRAGSGGVPAWALALIALIVVGGGVWAWRTFGRAPAAAGADPAVARATPQEASATGVRHMQAGEWVASLPWLRRATQERGDAQWQTHYALATALAKVTMLTTSRAGIEQPLARSSVERVALARDCEREYARAVGLAPPGPDRARVLRDFAEFQFAWGRAWEAFALFRQAQADVPGDAALAQRAAMFQFMLEHPEQFETVEQTMLRERQGR